MAKEITLKETQDKADLLSEEETKRRMDKALLRALHTPPKPHKENPARKKPKPDNAGAQD